MEERVSTDCASPSPRICNSQFFEFEEEGKNCSGSLVERIAARAGFHAPPRLNTQTIRSSSSDRARDHDHDHDHDHDLPLDVLRFTIPPGLSPTSLLDSPVFLSNSLLAHPSPTTGKFPFLPGGNNAAADHPCTDNHFDQSAIIPPPSDEDGYNWRKYGQKQVKGSEYPRSYFKCTHPTCQVKKKVERSHEGHITEIIYKGAHIHPKPPPNRRSANGSSSLAIPFGDDTQLHIPDQSALQSGSDCDLIWQKGTSADSRNDNLDVTSTPPVPPEFCHHSTPSYIESTDAAAVDTSTTFSNDEDEDDRGTHGSVSLGYDGEGDESESKRRKVEAYATEMSGATRAIREPRVVVQTTSEVDILDDGYRWRKYGQKVVKGNPNPRSYYKCTSAGCTVRKHVERASHDLKSVITTYEGKHNHDVPATRNSSHVNSTASTALPHQTAIQTHVHRPEPSQIHHSMARFERHASLGSFSLPPSHGFSFGMNQPGLANVTMAGLGPSQGKLPILPVNQYSGQQHQLNDMVFMMPKGEPKVEPISESGLNLSNSSVYQQIMSRLPLGP